MSKKLNVVLSDRDFEVLQELAAAQSRTLSDIVRDVLKVGVWYQKEIAATGSSLCVKTAEGVQRDIVLIQ